MKIFQIRLFSSFILILLIFNNSWLGAQALEIDKNGNVGIGTSTPSSKLQVAGDLILGNDEAGQRFIFHSRTNGNGDFLHISFDKSTESNGRPDWDWSKGIKLRRSGHVDIRGTLAVEERVTAKDFAGFGIVPIGTIIDWWRPTTTTAIPDGWRVANGDLCTGCDASLEGKALPNLTNKFVRGTAESSIPTIGYTTGGANSHIHSISLNTNTTGEHFHKWLVGYWRDDIKKWRVNSYGSSGQVVTVKDFSSGWTTDGSKQIGAAWDKAYKELYTNKQGNHSHTVNGNTADGNNVPEYVGMLKLVRVR